MIPVSALLIALIGICGAQKSIENTTTGRQEIVFQNSEEHFFEVRSTSTSTQTPDSSVATSAPLNIPTTTIQSLKRSTTRSPVITSMPAEVDEKYNITADRIGNENNKNCNCIRVDQCPLVGTRIVTPDTPCPNKNHVQCCIKPTSAPHHNKSPPQTCGFRSSNITVPDVALQPGQAPYAHYPWSVVLLDAKTNAYLGGGVLLNNLHVLTAAHKINSMDASRPEKIKVRLGDWDARGNIEPYRPIERNVTEIIINPNFNSKNLKGDLAILTLEEVVPLKHNPHIGAACVPASTSNFVGQRCWVSGWGKDAFEPAGNFQQIMKHVDVPVIDSTECEARLRDTKLSQYFELDRQSFLCAGGETQKDACTGDGGSPLVCESTKTVGQFYVVGLVAWGIGCATPGVPGVYVNVAGYSNWITEVTANFRNLEY